MAQNKKRLVVKNDFQYTHQSGEKTLMALMTLTRFLYQKTVLNVTFIQRLIPIPLSFINGCIHLYCDFFRLRSQLVVKKCCF